MIIAINQTPYEGPWGGGNRFIQGICEGLKASGHEVVHELSGSIDIILMVETRLRSQNVTFDAGGILRYLLSHPDTIVIHRINECDERKGEKFITHKLLRANYAADLTVFVGSWLKDLAAWQDKTSENSHVILNGADEVVFHSRGFKPWDGNGPIRLVTHHWGFHRYKGFDVYEQIDALLDNNDFVTRFSMHYIGRVPENYKFRNIKLIPPENGEALGDLLRSYHAYVTGSICEPGGNHQNEGARCGLPIIYRKSGCMPEYCGPYGIGYDGPEDVKKALEELHSSYNVYAERVKSYPYTTEKMVREWLAYFNVVIEKKDSIVKRRHLWRNPLLFLRNQIPV